MNISLRTKLLISLLVAIIGVGSLYATENGTGNTVVIFYPKKNDSGSVKPNIPPLIDLSATIDRDQVTIISSENVIARVTITDYAEEECYFDNVVSISPTYTCTLPDITGELTLHIIFDGIEYIGYLDLDW